MATPKPKSSRHCVTAKCTSFRVAGPTPHCRRHGGGFPCCYPGCKLGGVAGGDRPHHFCYGHGGGNLCTTKGCDTPARKGGLCKLHSGGKRCWMTMCESLAQGGSNFCNKHGGGDRCEIPNCTTNTFRKWRCKKHRDTLMTEPEPDTEPDIDYVEGFMIISCVPEDPKPRNSAITTRLHAINQSDSKFL